MTFDSPESFTRHLESMEPVSSFCTHGLGGSCGPLYCVQYLGVARIRGEVDFCLATGTGGSGIDYGDDVSFMVFGRCWAAKFRGRVLAVYTQALFVSVPHGHGEELAVEPWEPLALEGL